MASAKDVAETIFQWASENGYMLGSAGKALGDRDPIQEAIPEVEAPEDEKLERSLDRAGITGIAFDNPGKVVTVLTKGKLPARLQKRIPGVTQGVSLHWIGTAVVQQNPPPIPPSPPSTSRCYVHKKRIACGSSVTAANEWGAGSLGCLLKNGNGDLFGLSNNHVTGGCNHTLVDMPILSPAPFDASPQGPAPLAIGRHAESITLQSGNPAVVPPQQFDAAVFSIVDTDAITSMQGNGLFDTPSTAGHLAGGARVKKVGRTTGLTTGTVVGQSVTAMPVPYKHSRFSALVYFQPVWVVRGDSGRFSDGGDSGSLVVSDDGNEALGLVFAGMESVSLVLPLEPLLKKLKLGIAHNWKV